MRRREQAFSGPVLTCDETLDLEQPTLGGGPSHAFSGHVVRLLLRLLVGVLVVWLVAAVAGVPVARDLVRGAGDRAEGIARRLNPPAPTLSQSPAPSPRREPPRPFRSLPGRQGGRATPPPAATPDGVRSALTSVVQILVSSCGQDGAGSGFVAGRERVVTAAHVVEGASRVAVRTQSGAQLAARVVLYEPAADTAVLAVAGLPADPLRFAPAEADTGSSAWVAGHPRGGPLKVVDASVIGTVGATGSDGETYVLRTVVRPGNSGGPLLDAQGRVLGVVFATAADGDPEGYARTWPAVEDEVATGTRATATVPDGSC
jgi:S1-C subfamily serine protease